MKMLDTWCGPARIWKIFE